MSRHTSSWDALRLILPSVFWPELFSTDSCCQELTHGARVKPTGVGQSNSTKVAPTVRCQTHTHCRWMIVLSQSHTHDCPSIRTSRFISTLFRG